MALLDGRIVIVAGAGPGMGAAVARRAAAEGAAVVLAARSADRLATLRDEITDAGGRALAVPTDLVHADQVDALVDATLAAYGHVDALVHTAFTRPATGPLSARTPQEWHDALDGNVVAASTLVNAVAPHLRARRRGSIVLVSSISARLPYASSGIYATMKAGALTLTKVFAQELGPHNIRVNCVVPGYIESDELEAFFAHLARERATTAAQARTEAEAATSLRRFATATEVADAAIFLLSDLATAITGQSLDVNAGHWFG